MTQAEYLDAAIERIRACTYENISELRILQNGDRIYPKMTRTAPGDLNYEQREDEATMMQKFVRDLIDDIQKPSTLPDTVYTIQAFVLDPPESSWLMFEHIIYVEKERGIQAATTYYPKRDRRMRQVVAIDVKDAVSLPSVGNHEADYEVHTCEECGFLTITKFVENTPEGPKDVYLCPECAARKLQQSIMDAVQRWSQLNAVQGWPSDPTSWLEHDAKCAFYLGGPHPVDIYFKTVNWYQNFDRSVYAAVFNLPTSNNMMIEVYPGKGIAEALFRARKFWTYTLVNNCDQTMFGPEYEGDENGE